MMKKKILFPFVVLLLAVLACSSAAPAMTAEPMSSPVPAAPTQPLPTPESKSLPTQAPPLPQLFWAVVQEGEWMISAIERACVCSFYELENLGILWERNGQPYAYITNLPGLNNLNVLGEYSFVWQNDILLFGKVADVGEYASQKGYLGTDVMIVSGDFRENVDYLTVVGGPFIQSLTLQSQRDPRMDWVVTDGLTGVIDPETAIARATGNN